jgi:Tfp pilus assembly protein PilO
MSIVTTKRDRNLLLFLTLAVVFYLCYTFVINPALEERGRLLIELESMGEQLDQTEKNIADLPALKESEKKLREDLVEKYGEFMPSLDQGKLLKQLDIYTAGAGLRVSSYIPTLAVAAPVVVERGVYLPQIYPLLDLAVQVNSDLSIDPGSGSTQVSTEPTIESSDMVPGMDVAISFETSGYESVKGFIASVEGMHKTIILKNISISSEADGLQGQLLFTFYSLPPLDTAESGYLNYTPAIPQGKVNPFE